MSTSGESTPQLSRAVRRIVAQLDRLGALPDAERHNALLVLALTDAFNAGARATFGEVVGAIVEQLTVKAPQIQLEIDTAPATADLRSLLQQALDERGLGSVNEDELT